MSENITALTDDSFSAQVLKSETPYLVDFWAPWCAPCRTLNPVVEEIASSFAGRVSVGKVNIDEHPNTPSQYGVQSIPTLLLFKGGEVVEKIIGISNVKQKLQEMLTKHAS
jgi:thioredoxin 1